MDNALVEMRTALLEADVAVEVADDLLARVRERALSEEVMKSLTPAQQVIKVVRDELQATMGGTQATFSLPGAKPAIETEGFEIREATYAAQALSMAKEGPPDLMFLDLNTPGASGTNVLTTLKGDPKTKGIRVVVVTAEGEEICDYLMGLGADEYFTKPFSPTALVRTVEKVLAD